ncbi:MAG: response regulator [Polyangiaceae bacterium]|nr:response regulator [Polyangiaceae bacterium]
MPDSRPILLVEDNDDDVTLTRRALTKNGIVNELVRARDGVEALEWLHGEPPLRPAVVLLDLKMPRLGGLEVLTRLRADDRTRRLPIVVLTTSAEEQDLVQSYDRGANSYVRKPVVFEEFVRAVGQLGLYWLVLNEPTP